MPNKGSSHASPAREFLPNFPSGSALPLKALSGAGYGFLLQK
jgi:hypothetical protein